MKIVVFVALAAAMLVASPSFAEDGKISANELSALGLSGLQQISDAEGTQVRGRLNGNGMVIGTSLFAFQFVTPDTKNFINGSSVNMVMGNAQFGQAGEAITKSHNVGFPEPFNFAVGATDPTTGDTVFSFIGVISGSVGGFGGIALAP